MGTTTPSHQKFHHTISSSPNHPYSATPLPLSRHNSPDTPTSSPRLLCHLWLSPSLPGPSQPQNRASRRKSAVAGDFSAVVYQAAHDFADSGDIFVKVLQTR
ncbi:hypothetical protein HO173_005498 [Letharia columbiana]|uniref:Uncharacterized protein n=1 Tax=Letharia columbiana TaxID=112416 RepID=A0A8H6FX09_9LECA|nr:uncharacterized protein HO173_005498 [Letharia columbiana]KAF6236406.1 hypothetical protein HO173_005498 [Letharia columbiana]